MYIYIHRRRRRLEEGEEMLVGWIQVEQQPGARERRDQVVRYTESERRD